MKEQIVAKAYAQSLIELAEEAKVDAAKELTDLTALINKSNDLENVLFLDVFTVEEKETVLKEVLSKLGISSIVKNFISFLVNEKRIGILPLIFKEVIVIDDHNKGFLRGTIEGSDSELSAEFKAKMTNYLKDKLGLTTELTYVKNNDITAGYRVTVEDLQLDASLDNQLAKFKDSVLSE
ncbi:FoF1 ATP synthase subunit delta [Halobacteriovorax sp. HLS]|uniref:F0F1 ATP synthase subunit delta n=1 Tax=Halobacteriovorax sp. HLS TaxID=2234000 RepID=UPI000FD8A390|nr:F0F1 ATP synthase subunit delta [Halobacteriovorax sp. HLS]